MDSMRRLATIFGLNAITAATMKALIPDPGITPRASRTASPGDGQDVSEKC
jgi:hypothetical protein